MNWYKLAEAEEVTVTPDQFQAMGWEQKWRLSLNPRISSQAQQLFFTEKYKSNISVLQTLAKNKSITQETQLLFFTTEYDYKNHVLWWLAGNPSISLQTQRLFFTEEYKDKNYVLKHLLDNPSFLKDFTTQELREFTKAKEARLPVYRKRFKTIRAMVLL